MDYIGQHHCNSVNTPSMFCLRIFAYIRSGPKLRYQTPESIMMCIPFLKIFTCYQWFLSAGNLA
uniref:Ovule protein n=1 Tax=Heterorhabditis bacteriophora TaxID=37862 RepID=A0A1I7WW04_HETBA